jgi:glycosyltransferase involved in cell wall biosynthesis
LKSSARVFIRRILGRRRTFLLRNILSEVFFSIKIYEDPRQRPLGISAMTATYNEEEWIEPSLLSIKDLVDEYIVIDSSTDRTPEIIEKVRDEHGLNIRLYKYPPGDLSIIRNEILRLSSYRWILHWDGDFILYEGSDKYIRSLVETLDPRRHYLIYWPWIRICGDLYHTCGEHVEHWLFTYSKQIHYKNLLVDGRPFDSLIAPLRLYKAIYIDKVLGLHIQVKNPVRYAVKHLWYLYRSEYNEISKRTKISQEEFAKTKALELYGTDDLEMIGRKLIEDFVKSLPRFNGDYPKILNKYLSKKDK